MKHSIHRILRYLGSSLLCTMLLASTAGAVQSGACSLTEQYSFAGAVHKWYAEESYYSAPVVVDLDGDGRLEVINASHSIVVMDAATGAVKWRVNSGHDRSTPFSSYQNTSGQVFSDLSVKDIDGDGQKEIIAGYADGTLSVLNFNGYFKAGWPQRPTSAAIRSLVVEDVNKDGKCEIIAGVGVADSVSVWVYRHDGNMVPGWPQLDAKQDASKAPGISNTAYSYGVFGNGITVGNLDQDAELEIIVPTDTAFIDAYNPDGTLVPASPIYGGRTWGKVALYESYKQEILCENEGWGWGISGRETRAQLYRAELGHSAATYSDVDGDGVSEVVVTALIADRTHHTNTNLVTTADTRYMTALILNQDRTRYVNKALGFDWTTPPTDLGAPLKSVDPISIATGVLSEPVCNDLDGNGKQEILFTSYNGKLHCFSLDGKEHGNWPFTLPHSTSTVYEYATTPTCVDLNGDGLKEVIFASWMGNNQGANTGINGTLYVLDSNGTLLCSQRLHNGYATYEGVVHNSNNVLATPTVQDIDYDGKYEILLNTTYYALCAYEVNIPVNTVNSSQMAVTLDGTPISLNAYNLADCNYVMLRDVAYLLNGTKAQFSVAWSPTAGITLTKGQSYTPTGQEQKAQGAGAKPYIARTQTLNINGQSVPLQTCTIENNNYFKLRDLGQALGFNVTWDNASHTVLLNSN